jgi:hypothetical protein
VPWPRSPSAYHSDEPPLGGASHSASKMCQGERASRRLDEVCAPGYTGRKRGEVVRTRTTIGQAHSYHWLGSFGNRGNGRYREELRKGLAAITRYLSAYQLPSERTLLRLDGLYGTGAVLADLAGFAFVTRGKEYTALDHPFQPWRRARSTLELRITRSR